MSEEYTQSKAYLDAMSRIDKQESPVMSYLCQLEPTSETITRLTAERDEARREFEEARDSAKFWEDRFDVCASQLKGAEIEAGRFAKIAGDANTARYKAQGERDELAGYADAYKKERDEARSSIALVRETRDRAHKLLDKVTAERAALKSSRPKSDPVRLPYHNADGTPWSLRHPTGRIEALEARLAKLEGVVNAR